MIPVRGFEGKRVAVFGLGRTGLTAARALQDQLAALNDVLFIETNPGPVKYAASMLGKCRADLRLPLVLPSDAHQLEIRARLEGLGLLSE